MKIGIGSTTIDPKVNGGHIDGIGVYTQNLIEHYQALDNEIVKVFFPPTRRPLVTPSLPSTMRFLPYTVSSLSGLIPFFPTFNNKIEKKIDVFHATDYRIPRFKKIPIVATLHDAIMFKHPEWCNPKLRRIKNWLLKNSTQWVTHFIAISHAMVPDLVEFWGVDERKISVIHNAISDWWLEKVSIEEKNNVLTKLNLKENFLLFVGTLQPRKNILRVIEAFNLLPEQLQKEHKLVLVGSDGWRTDELKNKIQMLIDNNTGTWLKNTTNEELRALYQSASLCIFPSLSEGFGLPVLEAFASEVPVLTSNTTSLPEVAGNAAYFIDPLSVEEMTQGMIVLLTDPLMRNDLIEKGNKRVREFSCKKRAEQTLQLYQKLI